MRFVASADWQLGMRAHFLDDDARPRFHQARLDAVARIGRLATEREAEFVVVCGDVFEFNTVDTALLSRTFEVIKREFTVPVVWLPGNHDPLSSTSVYTSSYFTAHAPSTIHVLTSSEPYAVVDGVEIVGAPWFSKDPRADLANQAIDGLQPPAGRIRILACHGAVASRDPDRDNPDQIDDAALTRAVESGLVTMVVMGDHHSSLEVHPRIWYAGTPEVTRRTEANPGNALVIDLDAESCQVEPVHVGRWTFAELNYELSRHSCVRDLEHYLDEIPDKSRSVIWLRLSGVLDASQRVSVNQMIEQKAQIFASLTVKDDDLQMRADQEVVSSMPGFARQAAQVLNESIEQGSREAVDALTLLGVLENERRSR